jgi:acetolactate synthase-1/2/3 large subunit
MRGSLSVKTKLSTILVDHLKKWGVTDVFGIPGKSIAPLLFELQTQNINFVLSRHESGAGFEAAGYALTKKTLGVAIGTSGPGGTNMLTAAGQAKAYHQPVLFITGHPPILGTGAAQGQDSSRFGTDLVKMFEPVTLFSARVDRAELFPMYLRHAIEKAFTGSRGPVHLCIPYDVYQEEMESFDLPLPTHVSPVMSPDLDKVVSILDGAQRPVLFLGKGVGLADAYEEVRAMAEHWNIPVMTTPCGKGAFPTVHPLSLGGFGLGGTDTAAEYLKAGVDVMVVIGSKLSDMTLAGFSPEMKPKQVIHFDYEVTFTGKSISVPTSVILGDAKLNLMKMLEMVHAVPVPADFVRGKSSLASHEEQNFNLISSEKSVKALRSRLPEDAILFGDDGSHTFFAIKHYDIYQAGTFIFDDVFGAMGHAIGYAIGAKLGNPNKTVVCLTGDGCTMMHGTEFATAVNHQIPVIFVVLNNGSLDMVHKGMSHNTGRSVGTIYDVPLDAAQFAQSMGVTAYTCDTEAQIDAAMKACLLAKVPTLIEIMVDPKELPPILARADKLVLV